MKLIRVALIPEWPEGGMAAAASSPAVAAAAYAPALGVRIGAPPRPIVRPPRGLYHACSKAVILPRTIVNRTPVSAPSVESHFEVSRSRGWPNTAVAYRPRTLIDTTLTEHSSCACSWTTSAGVRHLLHPYGPSIRLISAGSENSRASAALFPASRFAVQARTTAF